MPGFGWPAIELDGAWPAMCLPGLAWARMGMDWPRRKLGFAWADVIMRFSGHVLVMVWCGCVWATHGKSWASVYLDMGWDGMVWAGRAMGWGCTEHMMGM
jgi:hypothetical protein